MIDGREPNYICLDTRALTLAKRLSDPERLAFFDGICASYAAKLNGAEAPAFPDDITGDLIRQAEKTLVDGFDKYMGRVYANPSGKKRTVDPTGSQWGANDAQSNQDQINKDQITQDQINQFVAEGYSESEIDDAIKRCGGKSSIRNISAYLRRTMDNVRQEKNTGKTVSAQDYKQRDYSSVGAEIKEEMTRRIEQHKKEHPEKYDENGRIIV